MIFLESSTLVQRANRSRSLFFSTTKKGSITCVQAVYVPADDLTDPAPATTFAHLDATTTLSRGIAELGIYPAVDPLDSKSRMLDPRIVGQEHYDIATNVQRILQDYKGCVLSGITARFDRALTIFAASSPLAPSSLYRADSLKQSPGYHCHSRNGRAFRGGQAYREF